MIIFRKDQLEAFRSVAASDFERVLVKRLSASFPRNVQWYGESAVRELVHLGVERTRELGLEREEDVLRYLGIMLLLGSGFDQDPQVTWAARALHAPSTEPVNRRVVAVWDLTRAYTTRVMGADGRYLVNAMQVLEGQTVDSLCSVAGRSSRDLLLFLGTAYPQKAVEVGEAPLQDLARMAVDRCQTLDIATREAVVLMTLLMFLFGAGMMSDPLTAWSREALKQKAARGVQDQLEALLQAANLAARRISV